MASESHISASKRTTGELSAKVLVDILSDIRKNRSVATLLVARESQEKCFYFTIGAIRMVKAGPAVGLSLGQLLLSRELCDQQTLDEAEKKRASMEVPLNEESTDGPKRMVRPLLEDVLSMEDMVPRRELLDAVGEVVCWELEEVFFWEDGTYTLWPGSPPVDIYRPDMDAHKMSFGVDKMLKDLEDRINARGQREAKILGGQGAVTRGRGRLNPRDELDHFIFECICQPSQTVLDAVRVSRKVGIRPTAAAVRLLELEAKNSVAISANRPSVPPKVLSAKAGEIENWLENLIDGLAATGNLAQIYEQLNDTEKAVEYRRVLAEKLAEEGNLEDALAEFDKILKVSDRDFPTYERMLELLESLKRNEDLTKLARDYAEVLSVNNLFNRAKKAWNYFLGLVPTDIAARRQLVDVHLQLNDKKSAVSELQNIVQLTEQQSSDSAEIEAAVVDVLKLAPNDQTAFAKYKSIKGFASAKFLRSVLMIAMLAVVVIALILAFLINQSSRNFVAARNRCYSQLKKGEFNDAHKTVTYFISGQSGLFSSFTLTRAKDIKAYVENSAQQHYEHLYKSQLNRASWLSKNNALPESLVILEAVGDEIRGINDGLCPDRDRWIRKIDQALEAGTSRRKQALKNFDQAKKLLREGKSERAHRLFAQLARSEQWISDLDKVSLPVLIESTPSNSSVLQNGQSVGQTPVTISVSMAQILGESVDLVVQNSGYAEAKVSVSKLLTWPVSVALKREVVSTVQSAPVEANLVNSEGLSFVADSNGFVKCFNNKNGELKLKWQRQLGLGHDPKYVAVSSDCLAVVTGSGQVFSLDPVKGSILWNEAASNFAPVIANTARHGTIVVFVNADNQLSAVKSTNGQIVWTSNHPPTFSATPLLIGTRLIVSTSNGRAGIISLQNGKTVGPPIRIRTNEYLPAPLLIKQSENSLKLVYILEGGDVLWTTINTDSYEIKSRKTGLNVALSARALIADGQLCVYSLEEKSRVFVFDLETQEKLFSTTLPTRVTAAVADSRQALIVGTKTGVYALSKESNRILWHHQTNAAIVSAPASLKEGILFATLDGEVSVISN